MHARAALRLLVLLGSLGALAGCVTSTSRRGEIEFGRMQLLTTVDEAPRPAVVPRLHFPEVLLAQGIEGTAEISFVVDELGVPRDVTVIAASAPAFGEAAVEGIQRFRYVPAEANGKRVSCGVGITIFFRQD